MAYPITQGGHKNIKKSTDTCSCKRYHTLYSLSGPSEQTSRTLGLVPLNVPGQFIWPNLLALYIRQWRTQDIIWAIGGINLT